jgi:NAD(P)-dependent dehydrogenase (short-subunit alcohol dehydrogenase family)
MELRDAVAVVTGASRGIGRATALALARAGARVVVAARDVAALQAVAVETGGVAVECDVTRREDVERLVATAGDVDVLVANAGAYIRRDGPHPRREDFERSLAVNFYGALDPLLGVLPRMVARRHGHIVLVSSIDGLKALPGDAPYSVAKFALAGLGDALRQDLRPHGVGVTTVFPGRVDTPMVEELRVPLVSRKIPPDAVARAIVKAIRHDRAEIVLPRLGLAFVYADALSPRLGDWAARRFGLGGRWTER